MLQAKSEKGELIRLANHSTEEIAAYRKQTQFYCPTCYEKVLIKAGKVIIPHFAHQFNQKCPSREGGEGSYHEKGKYLLFEWLKSQGLDVQLEYYIKEIKQQPDLLLTLNQKYIAIEYQCARVPIEEIESRNRGYQRLGIIPIWILGANRFKRIQANKLKVDRFTQQFIHQFSEDHPLILFYFCPETLEFISFTGVTLSQASYALGSFNIKKLNEITFISILKPDPFSTETLYHLWKNEKKKFRLRYRKQTSGKERAWHQYIYLKKTHLEYLPSIVHIPLSHQFKMKSPPWDWQSRLYLEVIEPLEVGKTFTLKACEDILKHHIYQHDFLLIRSSTNPIEQYLHLLKKLEYIEEFSPKTYTKVIEIKKHVHVEASIRSDQAMMAKLIEKIDPNHP